MVSFVDLEVYLWGFRFELVSNCILTSLGAVIFSAVSREEIRSCVVCDFVNWVFDRSIDVYTYNLVKFRCCIAGYIIWNRHSI